MPYGSDPITTSQKPAIPQTDSTMQKHYTHKYRDILKLDETNWIDWKDIMKMTAQERGLWGVVSGKDVRPADPDESDPDYQLTLTQIDEWKDRDIAARNQMVLNMAPAVRMKYRSAQTAAAVWKKLLDEFESKDSERIAILWIKYERLPCDSRYVFTYIDELVKLRERLKMAGEDISDIAFAARLLRDLPESWHSATKMIRMLIVKPETIIQKFREQEAADKADNSNKLAPKTHNARALGTQPSKGNRNRICKNCELPNHSIEECYDFGGGREKQWPSYKKYVKIKNPNYDPNAGSRYNRNRVKRASLSIVSRDRHNQEEL